MRRFSGGEPPFLPSVSVLTRGHETPTWPHLKQACVHCPLNSPWWTGVPSGPFTADTRSSIFCHLTG